MNTLRLFQDLLWHAYELNVKQVIIIFIWTLVVGVVVNSLHTMFAQSIRAIFGLESELWSAAASLAAALGLAAGLVWVIRWRLNPARWVPYSGVNLVPKRPGLILLVSREESAMFAIRHHFLDGPLRKVWLIPSAVLGNDDAAYFGESSLPIAQAIRASANAMARSAGRELEIIIHPTGVSPSDSQATFDYVRRIIRERHFQADEIVADFTGGTKPMTIGLVMACLSPDIPLEYVPFHTPTKHMHGPFFIDYRSELFDL